MDLIQLPNTDQMKNTYKGERIRCVPVSRGTGRERQALRRKQWSHTAELSSCWPRGIRPLVCSSKLAVQIGFGFLCFTLEAGGGSGAALVLTTRGLWKRDHKRGQRSNVTNQIISCFQGWCADSNQRRSVIHWGFTKKKERKGKDFFLKRQIEVII